MNTLNISNVFTLISAAFIAFISGCGNDDMAGSTATVTTTSSEPSPTATSTSSTTDALPTTTTTTTSGASDSESASSSDGTTSGTMDSSTTSSSTTGTSDVSTTSTSTSGDLCEDSNDPPCACHVMDEPQHLFGLTWNYGGQLGLNGMEELRCINPETGESQLIAQIPGMQWVYVGTNAYDPDNHVLHVIGSEPDLLWRLFTIDTVNGNVLENHLMEPDFYWLGGIYLRSDMNLVGMAWNDKMSQAELRSLDPKSGNSNLIVAIPEITLPVQQGVNAYDTVTDTIFLIANNHVFSIDAMDGMLLSSPSFNQAHTWSALFLRSDSQLVAILTDGEASLSKVDPATAVIELIAPLPGFQPLQIGTSVYDHQQDKIFAVSDGHLLFHINATSGQIVASPMLTPPNDVDGYNWSGDLYAM